MIIPFTIIGPDESDIRNHKPLQTFASWINRFTYKPNTYFRWGLSEFQYHRDGYNQIFLDIVMDVVDATTRGKIVPVSHRSTISFEYLWSLDFTGFKHFVLISVRNAEMHEMDEFLTLDGEIIHDPHKNEKIF